MVGTVPVWENRVLLCRRAIEPRTTPGQPGSAHDEAEIPWDDLAFRTVSSTLRRYFEDRKHGAFGPHHYTQNRTLKLPWLAADTPFPPAEFALTEPDGLLRPAPTCRCSA